MAALRKTKSPEGVMGPSGAYYAAFVTHMHTEHKKAAHRTNENPRVWSSAIGNQQLMMVFLLFVSVQEIQSQRSHIWVTQVGAHMENGSGLMLSWYTNGTFLKGKEVPEVALSRSVMKVWSDNKSFSSCQDKTNTPWRVLVLSKQIQSVC